MNLKTFAISTRLKSEKSFHLAVLYIFAFSARCRIRPIILSNNRKVAIVFQSIVFYKQQSICTEGLCHCSWWVVNCDRDNCQSFCSIEL